MIRYTRGNLLSAEAEALVNTVNEVGVMGKGVALMFRDAFPENTRIYLEAVKDKQVHVGRVLLTHNPSLLQPRWIINFPTKKHWRQPSRIEWIREGLRDLVRVLKEHRIKSVALPPLGCGNGGLEWSQVRVEIEGALAVVPEVDVLVYEPIGDYLNAPKRSGLEELTPARALIAELVRRYSVLGFECSNLEVQKLAWFLQRVIKRFKLPDPLDLRFEANRYGPYADRLRHLLDGLDGSYLHCEKRLSDAKPLDAVWFEDTKRDTVQTYLTRSEAQQFQPALLETEKIIDGFESPLGMELLATVDWLISRGGAEPTLEGIKVGIAKWPGGKTAARRKQALFDDRLLTLALDRLKRLS
jgi:O-acetyl-ADP-ribose deacetylase (regulator of RNase III)